MVYDYIKWTGWVTLGVGFFVSFYVGNAYQSLTDGIYVFLSSFVAGILFIGFASLIKSAYRIEMKIVGEPEVSDKIKRFRGDFEKSPNVKD